MQHRPHFAAQHNVKLKDNTENSDFLFFLVGMIDSAEPVPSTSFELVDNRLSTQEGKQTSQELASTS